MIFRRPLLLLSLACAPISGRAEGNASATWAQWFNPELRQLEQRQSDIRQALDSLPHAAPRPGNSTVGSRSQPASTAEEVKWVQIDLGREYPIDDILLVPAWFQFGEHPGPGFGFPVRFKVEVANEETFLSPTTVADYTKEDFPNPGLAPVAVRVAGKPARYVRVTVTKLWRRIDDFVFALGEILVVSGNRNRAYQRGAKASDSFEQKGVWSMQYLTDDASVLGNPTDQQLLPTNGHHSALSKKANVIHWVQVDLGKALPLERITLIPARPVDFPDTIGFGFPPRFRLEISDAADFSNATPLVDHTAADFPNPGDIPVEIKADGRSARFVRMTATELWPREEDVFVMALAEMKIFSAGRNAALEKPVTASDSVEVQSVKWNTAYLTDGFAPNPGLGNISDWLTALARRQSLEGELGESETRRSALMATAISRLVWTAGGLVTGIAALSFFIHRNAKLRHHREARRIRQDIAQDLHDEVGSNLGSIAILSQMALDSAPDGESMRHEVEEIHRVAKQTTDSMREIVWLIGPGEKTTLDLADRLKQTAAAMLTGMDWTITTAELKSIIPLTAQRDVLLILKEALHNIRKHAHARSVAISLSESAREFRMEIKDDGQGFHSPSSGGHGLNNMTRRTERLQGRLEVDSSSTQGTTVKLTLPLS